MRLQSAASELQFASEPNSWVEASKNKEGPKWILEEMFESTTGGSQN